MDSHPAVKRRRTREDRRRTARACDRCRRLKERCEGGFPCTRCVHLGRHCEFKPLSSQTRDTDHLLFPMNSPTKSVPELNVPELLERATYMENILKHKFEGIALDVESLRRMSRALDQHAQDADRPATPLPMDEDPIEEEVCTIDPVEDTTTHFSGEFSYWNFSMRLKRHIEDRMVSSLQQPQRPLQVSNYWRAEQLRPGVSRVAEAISCCPPRHVADFLVNIFFKHVQTYYFYVDKSWLMEQVSALYADPNKFSRKSAAVVSIVLTVLAIATQYAYLDSARQRASSANTEFSEDALGAMFYQQAIQLLPETIEASSLESVQACLLFAIYALPVDASGLGYIYITLTNRLGMQNGMHRQYKGTGLSPTMIETRNRIWWTAYTLERKISILHGRPLSTHQSDVDARLPTVIEAIEGDDSSSTVPYMVASVLLTRRLEGFSHDLFILRTCEKHERSSILSRLTAEKKELDAWWETLPDEVRNNVAHPQESQRAITHLHLEHCLVRMFIGRPLLLSRASSRSAPSSPEDNDNHRPKPTSANSSETGTSGYTADRQGLVVCCVQASQEALKLCHDLRDKGPGLARASYVEYSSCRASLLVLIAHSIENQTANFRTQIRGGLDMIREMAAAGDSAQSEVALLESLERALARLLPSQKKDPQSRGSDYEHFKHWEATWKSSSVSYLPENENSPWAASPFGPPQSRFSEPYQVETPANTSNYDYGQLLPGSAYANDATTLGSAQSELRLLQEFLAIPGYRFDGEFEMTLAPFY
ncbi:transcription factor domain-containing protein [Aspergillus undulatus]|uniref:transcription factor domain-containing protein n=1 Tax=Aspergillus undulatus TaxID=1810928 RepID=UPI003CCE4E72